MAYQGQMNDTSPLNGIITCNYYSTAILWTIFSFISFRYRNNNIVMLVFIILYVFHTYDEYNNIFTSIIIIFVLYGINSYDNSIKLTYYIIFRIQWTVMNAMIFYLNTLFNFIIFPLNLIHYKPGRYVNHCKFHES